MHALYPQFATRGEHGVWQQQDANECFTELLREFSGCAEVETERDGTKEKIPVRRFLEGQFEVEMKNLESEEEPVTTSKESFLQVSPRPVFTCSAAELLPSARCALRAVGHQEQDGGGDPEELGGAGQGLQVREEDADQPTARLLEHPDGALLLQGEGPGKSGRKSADALQINAKVLKDVKFPMVLDVFELCTPELQRKLQPRRDAFKEYEDKKVEELRTSKLGDGQQSEPTAAVQYLPSGFEDDPGSNNSGFYQLNAVITHKGRSSNSGHYVAWVRLDEKRWAMCDDDEVHEVTEEQIQKLSGGGDWHCAYVLLYGPRLLPAH